MRPVDRLPKKRESKKVNVVWSYLEGIFDQVFHEARPWKDGNTAKSLYVSPSTNDIRAFPEAVRDGIPALQESGYGVGDNECALLDYLCRENVLDPLLCLGGVGHGKTTLLRHFLEQVIPNLRELSGLVTVYVDLVESEPELNNGTKSVEQVVIERLHVAFRQQLDDPTFRNSLWSFIDKEVASYSPYASMTRVFNDSIDSVADRQQYSGELRVLYMRQEPMDFAKAVLTHLARSSGLSVLVVIDNIDGFEPRLQIGAYQIARRICHDNSPAKSTACEVGGGVGAIKCILALRDSTWEHLCHRWGQQLDKTLDIRPPSLRAILDKRFVYVRQQEETVRLMASLRQTPLHHHSYNYVYDDVARVFECLYRTLVGPSVSGIVSDLSNGNVRYGLGFAERFLKSYEIPDRWISSALFDLYIDREIPDHIAVRALLLGGHDTFIEGTLTTYSRFLNIFSSSGEPAVYSHSVSYRLLSYITKVASDSGKTIRKSELAPLSTVVYPKLDIDQVLKTFLHFGLIESPEASVVEQYDMMQQFRIAPAGRYYHDALVGTLNYVECVKDVTDMGDECAVRPRAQCSSLADLVSETLAFCDWLVGREVRELDYLRYECNAAGKLAFRAYCGHEPCVVLAIMLRVADSVRRLTTTALDIAEAELPKRAESILAKARQLDQEYKSLLENLR